MTGAVLITQWGIWAWFHWCLITFHSFQSVIREGTQASSCSPGACEHCKHQLMFFFFTLGARWLWLESITFWKLYNWSHWSICVLQILNSACLVRYERTFGFKYLLFWLVVCQVFEVQYVGTAFSAEWIIFFFQPRDFSSATSYLLCKSFCKAAFSHEAAEHSTVYIIDRCVNTCHARQ